MHQKETITTATGTETTDQVLMHTFLCEGSQEAFRLFYERYYGFVCGKARRAVGGNRSTAEEITQTVFIILVRKISQLASYQHLGGWLSRTTDYVVANHYRKEQLRTEYESKAADLATVDANGGDIGSTLDTERGRQMLKTHLAELPQAQRDAIELHCLQGIPISKVGDLLGLSQETVRSRIRLGFDKLRKRIGYKGIEFSSAVLVAALEKEAQATELPIGDWRLPIGENAEVPERVRTAADAVMAEMDKAATVAMWCKIGVVAAGLATIGVGTALVVSHLHAVPAPESTTVSWRIESVAGDALARRGEATRSVKAGDGLSLGDVIRTSSNEEVAVVSDGGDRVLLREEGELSFETGNWKLETGPLTHSGSSFHSENSTSRSAYLLLGKGAIVAQLTHPMRVATPQTGLETSGADFFLMVAEATKVFTRVDVSSGTAMFPGSKLEIAAGQAVCTGPNVPTKTMQSKGREFSPKYGGVFFKEVADSYTRGKAYGLTTNGWSLWPRQSESAPVGSRKVHHP